MPEDPPKYVRIDTLPPEHPLRNKPLAEIGARYQQDGFREVKRVGPKDGIAKATFNKLGSVWTHNTVWEAQE
jgi:hypothetical protein